MGVCGLDCASCEIRRLPFDAEAAARTVAWFHREGWLKESEGVEEALARSMYCKGCRGDRSRHWSTDCWILQCCVDRKRLRSCAECGDFPCPRMIEWSTQDSAYSSALDALRTRNRSSLTSSTDHGSSPSDPT
jgi:hypothetical protein